MTTNTLFISAPKGCVWKTNHEEHSAHAHTQSHTHSQTHTHTHTITNRHTYTHTRTRKHARTHTHTHTGMQHCSSFSSWTVPVCSGMPALGSRTATALVSVRTGRLGSLGNVFRYFCHPHSTITHTL